MNYIIMILIVIGLVLADYITGVIKAYCTATIESAKMRKGGLNKLCEIIVMAVAIGLDIGLGKLGAFYGHEELSGIAGVVTAVSVFVYIVAMELISILENYSAINTEARWARRFVKKLKVYTKDDESEGEA